LHKPAVVLLLGERGAADQAVREAWMAKLQRGVPPDSQDLANTLSTDEENTQWLVGIVEREGWPGLSRVGPEAANAAFLIVQHSPDTAFQREMLPVIKSATEEGEAEGQQLCIPSPIPLRWTSGGRASD
jgi:hypothetical protein